MPCSLWLLGRGSDGSNATVHLPDMTPLLRLFAIGNLFLSIGFAGLSYEMTHLALSRPFAGYIEIPTVAWYILEFVGFLLVSVAFWSASSQLRHPARRNQSTCPWPGLSPRWWPEKSPPLRCFQASFSVDLSSLLAGLSHAERLAFGDDDDAVVEEPVEQADGGGVLGQEPPPLLEGPVRADAEGAALVGGGDEAEEQLGAGVVQRREADLVDHDEVGAEHRSMTRPTELSARPR